MPCVNRVNSFLASVNGMCFYTVWLDADACIICIMLSPGPGQKKSVYQTNCYRDSGTIWLVCRLKQIDLDTQMRIDTLFPGLSFFVAFIQNFILYFVICLEALAALEDLIHDLENNDSYNAQFNNAMHSFSFGKSWAWNSQKLKLKSLKVPFEQSFLLHQSTEIHDTKKCFFQSSRIAAAGPAAFGFGVAGAGAGAGLGGGHFSHFCLGGQRTTAFSGGVHF